MCNGTFQHNFQPLEKETEIAINTVADPELQIGVCVCVCVCVCGKGGGRGGTCDKWGRGGGLKIPPLGAL